MIKKEENMGKFITQENLLKDIDKFSHININFCIAKI